MVLALGILGFSLEISKRQKCLLLLRLFDIGEPLLTTPTAFLLVSAWIVP